MNRAQAIAVEQPWVSGPFRWPGEVDLKAWEQKEPRIRLERVEAHEDTDDKVLAALGCGLSLTPGNIGINCGMTPRQVGGALKRLAQEGLVERTTAISNFWRLI